MCGHVARRDLMSSCVLCTLAEGYYPFDVIS